RRRRDPHARAALARRRKINAGAPRAIENRGSDSRRRASASNQTRARKCIPYGKPASESSREARRAGAGGGGDCAASQMVLPVQYTAGAFAERTYAGAGSTCDFAGRDDSRFEGSDDGGGAGGACEEIYSAGTCEENWEASG